MVTVKSWKWALCLTCAMGFSTAAQAWNPFADADDGSADPAVVTHTPRPGSVYHPPAGAHPLMAPPARVVYNNPAPAAPAVRFNPPMATPVTAAPAYTPPPVYVQPPTYTPPPAVASAPQQTMPAFAPPPPPQSVAGYQPAAGGAPVTTTYSAPASAYPITYAPAPAPQPYAQNNAYPDSSLPYYAEVPSGPGNNRYKVGLEAFHDHYEEPDAFPDLKSNSAYGALDLGWEHYYTRNWYSNIDLRGSYGKEDYKSNSGKVDNSTQWEADGRIMMGYDLAGRSATKSHIKTYAGLGTRYFNDEFKHDDIPGTYDRRILQFYLPIGMTYEYTINGWKYAPNIELDPLLYGHVESRLQTIPGLSNASNRQELFSGMGVRAEFMASKLSPQGQGIQFGPFVRYWDIDDSEIDHFTGGSGTEPRNTRLQLGAKVNYLF